MTDTDQKLRKAAERAALAVLNKYEYGQHIADSDDPSGGFCKEDVKNATDVMLEHIRPLLASRDAEIAELELYVGRYSAQLAAARKEIAELKGADDE